MQRGVQAVAALRVVDGEQVVAVERGPVAGQPMQYEPPRPPMTLAEAAEELELTSAQEASLAVMYRDAEQDLVNMLFGNRSIEDVKQELARAKDDPDAHAAMVQGALMRGFSNAGKFITYERRMRKKIEDILWGVHQSIASRSAALMRRVGIEDEITFTGGVTRNVAMVKALEKDAR